MNFLTTNFIGELALICRATQVFSEAIGVHVLGACVHQALLMIPGRDLVQGLWILQG
jgi:hypothetical protein